MKYRYTKINCTRNILDLQYSKCALCIHQFSLQLKLQSTCNTQKMQGALWWYLYDVLQEVVVVELAGPRQTTLVYGLNDGSFVSRQGRMQLEFYRRTDLSNEDKQLSTILVEYFGKGINRDFSWKIFWYRSCLWDNYKFLLFGIE